MQDTGPPALPRVTADQAAKTTCRILARAPLFFLATSAIQMLPEPLLALLHVPPPGHWYDPYVPILIAQLLVDLVQAAALHKATRLLAGRGAPLAETVVMGAGRALPVLLVSLIQFAASALGSVLLVVPGFYVAAGLTVAGPICLDGEAPLRSLRRSWTMTHGVRWRIAGAILWLWMPYLVGTFCIGAYNGFTEHILPYQDYIAGAGAVVLSALGAILPAVVYRDLRGDPQRQQLSEVFA